MPSPFLLSSMHAIVPVHLVICYHLSPLLLFYSCTVKYAQMHVLRFRRVPSHVTTLAGSDAWRRMVCALNA